MEINQINTATIEEVKRTTYTKTDLESSRAALITQRDAQLADLSAKFQPAIDHVSALLKAFK